MTNAALVTICLLCLGYSAGASIGHKKCKGTTACQGRSCDDWISVVDMHYSCSYLENDYSCDCSGCSCESETNSCKNQIGCYQHSCTFWSEFHKLSCHTVEKIYGCDCSGCACEAAQTTTPKMVDKPDKATWTRLKGVDCVSDKMSDNLHIGEGMNSKGRQTYDRWTVSQCQDKCLKNKLCNGINYNYILNVCRYKRVASRQHTMPGPQHDCYILERSTPSTQPVVITTPSLRRTKHCNEVVCGGKSHCVDTQTGFACYCATGWIGGGANKVCQDVNECIGTVCGGDSVCFNGLNFYTCMCEEGWRGGGDNNLCTANMCTCENGKPGTGSKCPVHGANKCVSCNHGYDLQMDDTCVDMCASKSCHGHGTCYAGRCYCSDGYTGSDCADAPDRCAAVHCGQHGRCFDATCFCEDFYTGDDCSTPPGRNGGGTVVVHG